MNLIYIHCKTDAGILYADSPEVLKNPEIRTPAGKTADCPLIRDVSGEVLWAVLLRNSARYPVADGTRRVLRLYAVQEHLQHQC